MNGLPGVSHSRRWWKRPERRRGHWSILRNPIRRPDEHPTTTIEGTSMQIVSYLFFKNSAAEAFDFYAKCLGGKVTMKVTMGEMPGTENLPAEARNLIAHVRLEAGNAILMGSDWCGPTPDPYPGIHGNAVSVSVDEPAEAERLFKALSEAGKVTMPIAETSWALRFGMFTDRYGAPWMINCNRPQ